jgi:DNA-binding transcriptional ArsR family regulator
MPRATVELLQQPDQLRLALSPIRRQLLNRLREPLSATELATQLEMGRQRVNYHLRALEDAGLIDLVEERQRRGCTERILVARANAFIVDPSVMAPGVVMDSTAAQDRFAAEHLLSAAVGIVRDVTRMRANAEQQRTRLLTFTLETELSFASPGDIERFSSELAEFVARAAAQYNAPSGGRRYRVVVGGHPAPRKSSNTRSTSHERIRPRPHRSRRRRTH